MVCSLTGVIPGVISLYGFDAQSTAPFAILDTNSLGVSLFNHITVENPSECHGKITVSNRANDLKKLIHKSWIISRVDQGNLRRYCGMVEGWKIVV